MSRKLTLLALASGALWSWSVAAADIAPAQTTATIASTPSQQDGLIRPYIVGGEESVPGSRPWMVSLQRSSHFCGGSLIKNDWVLTAAHCVDGSSTSGLYAVVGRHAWNGSGGQRIAVSQIIVHPSYNDSTSDHDIALLKLSSPVTLGLTLMQLPDADLINEAAAPGDIVTVLGWGTTTEGGSIPSNLREVDVPVVSNATCNASIAYNGQITNNMMCAGYAAGGKDSCQGDSGGPLVHNNGGTWQLVGVVSFGIGCADPNYYGVYARVSRYREWISGYVPPPQPETGEVFFPVVLDVGAAPPPGSGFVNGNFENGPGVGWDESSPNSQGLIGDQLPDSVTAHSGSFAAWLGGIDSEVSNLSQQVTVPAGQKLLRFYHIIDSEDSCGFDSARVLVAGDPVATYDLCQDNNAGSWQQATLDLSAWAGQSVLVEFVAETDESSISSWFIDDVSFASGNGHGE